MCVTVCGVCVCVVCVRAHMCVWGGGEGGQCILKGDSVYYDGMSGGDTVSGGTSYPVTPSILYSNRLKEAGRPTFNYSCSIHLKRVFQIDYS